MRIFIDEEYGYREWTWDFPGTVEELIAEWKAGRIPPVGYVHGREFRGTCEPADTPRPDPYLGVTEEMYLADPDKYDEAYLSSPESLENIEDTDEFREYCKLWEVFFSKYDAECHVHEEEDSVLRIKDGEGKVVRIIGWTAEVDHGHVTERLIQQVRDN